MTPTKPEARDVEQARVDSLKNWARRRQLGRDLDWLLSSHERLTREVGRLQDAVLSAEADIKALGFEAHPAVLMRLDRLVRAIREAQPK